MSNLEFATKTRPVNLKNFLAKGKNKWERKLAYATVVSSSPLYPDTYYIHHHGNTIAEIEPFNVTVTNAGYGTPTTRNRINKILRDNNINAVLIQENFKQKFFFNGETITNNFYAASFEMVAGIWVLQGM
jgi:hypothetical protein